MSNPSIMDELESALYEISRLKFRCKTLEAEHAVLLEACEKMVAAVDRLMNQLERPCPFCDHNYIHTTSENIGQGDRWLERDVCPYPLLKAAIEKARGE